MGLQVIDGEPDGRDLAAGLHQLRVVLRLMTALYEADLPIAAFYEEATEAVVTAVGADRAALLVFDPDGVMRFKSWRGLSPEYRQAVEGHTPWSPDDTDAEPILIPDVAGAPALAGLLPVLVAEGIKALAFVPLVNRRRVAGKFVLYYDKPHGFSRAEIAVAEIFAAQIALALDRRRLYEERERTLAANAFLAEASAVLGSSLDYEQTLHRIAEVAVPRLADWCAIYLLEEGRIVNLAIAHESAERAAALRQLLERFPVSLNNPTGVGAVIRTGRADVQPRISDLDLVATASTPEHLDLLRSVGFGAALTVPLTVRSRTIGALTLANQQCRPFGDDTLWLAEELASRAAAGIDNARMYRQQARISHKLQASLLPPSLPGIPRLQLAARYSAGGAGINVGGDFYDVFPLDDRRFLAVIGDVCGRGLEAATLATLVRHSIRSAAVTEQAPGAIIAHINEVLLRQDEPSRHDPRFCTAIVAVIDPSGEAVTVDLAVAGHPLPLLRRADGTVAAIGARGSLVGVDPEARVTETRLRLCAGETLVCFTDGVTERRFGDTFFGEDGLVRTVSATDGDAQAVAAAVEAAVLAFAEHPPDDDLAVLVLRSVAPSEAPM